MAAKILTVFGTRPEAIKMAPLALLLARDPRFESRICVTGQHREMLDQVLDLFRIRADLDLNVMKPGQDLTDLACSILIGMREVFTSFRPDLMLVHGDTSTTPIATLALYYHKLIVAHIQQRLRYSNPYSPLPLEAPPTHTPPAPQPLFP